MEHFQATGGVIVNMLAAKTMVIFEHFICFSFSFSKITIAYIYYGKKGSIFQNHPVTFLKCTKFRNLFINFSIRVGHSADCGFLMEVQPS